MEILVGIIIDVIIWRVLLLLRVSPQTAELILLLLLILTVLGGGIYVGTGHHILA